MNYDIVEALSQIAREKSVELRVLVERLEASLLSAAKRKHGANAQVTINFDEAEGGIEMFLTKTVVGRVSDRGLEMTSLEARAYRSDASVGDDIIIPLDIMEFGRNAIQAAKQVLIQGVREAERERVYTDFVDKVGSVVRGIVQQVDRGTIVLKLDTAEAVIPAREVLHRDRFRQREMVRALVIDVDKEAKGPQIILSRSHPDFLTKLFALEVPEIAERIVEIKAVAREPGHRSKIAVYSNDDRVDAVGACVGIKGSRVQSIVKELGGERIDIVPWSADPVVFVSRSLAPAKVLEAKADPETHKVTVIVPDDQLSLAIGKQGQNARLAAKLSGWKIELHSESDYAAETAVERADVPVEELDGVAEAMVPMFHAVGIETALDIERKGLEGLQEIEGLSEAAAERTYGVALEALAAARAAAAAEAARSQDDPAADEGPEDEATQEVRAVFENGAEETDSEDETGSADGDEEGRGALIEAAEAGEAEAIEEAAEEAEEVEKAEVTGGAEAAGAAAEAAGEDEAEPEAGEEPAEADTQEITVEAEAVEEESKGA
jgi:N utilization substance protein A